MLQSDYNTHPFECILYYCYQQGDTTVYETNLSNVCNIAYDGSGNIQISNWLIIGYGAPSTPTILAYTLSDVLAFYNAYYVYPVSIEESQPFITTTAILATIRTTASMVGYIIFDTTANIFKTWNGSAWIQLDSATFLALAGGTMAGDIDMGGNDLNNLGSIGTPSAGVLTNCTGLPISSGVSGLGANVATFLATPSSANLISAVTDETGTGALVFATSPTLVTPVLGTASAASLAFSSTSGVIGTTTNDNAAAGSVGEVIESTIGAGSAVALTSGGTSNIGSISLTAGDWDCWGLVTFISAGATIYSALNCGINTTSATMPTAPSAGAQMSLNITFPAGAAQVLPCGQRRFSLAATTTVYLVASTTFTVSTASAYGYIGARRRR